MNFTENLQKKWCAIADQQTNSVRIYDLDEGVCDETSQVWAFHAPWKNVFQDIRLRIDEKGREVLLAACDTDYACMLDVLTQKVLWSTHNGANNPHAIELLPNGILALASSNGAEVRFFDLKSDTPDQPLASFSLCEAHGLLYDPRQNRLWALGHTELHLLNVNRIENSIEVIDEANYSLPSEGGHDLQPVLGSDGTKLWITNFEGVWQFSVSDGSFEKNYPGADMISCENTKGIGNYADGTVISIVPDGGFLPWTAYSFRMFTPGEKGYTYTDIAISEKASYKVRVWTARYCE